MGIVRDLRTDAERDATIGYVIATDSFMSGWGAAPRRSLFAVAIMRGPMAQVAMEDVAMRFRARREFRRVRWTRKIPRLNMGDHVSIEAAERFTYGRKTNPALFVADAPEGTWIYASAVPTRLDERD